MGKFSNEFKEKIVLEYLDGNTSYRILSKKYNLNSFSLIREWVKLYSANGMEGLGRKKAIRKYPIQFKLDAVKYMVETGSTSLETAVQFNINNSSTIRSWYRELYEQEAGSPNSTSKGQFTMSKKPKKPQQKKNGKHTREQQLEREMELLKLENSYLKKLKAFRENPNAFHEKHKQVWHSSSKKKDSD